MGVGTSAVAAIRQGRKGIGAELVEEYVTIARQRVKAAHAGTRRTRPIERPVYQPNGREKVAQAPILELEAR
jgi:adenine-specific DNA-methyltransferase